MRLDMVYLVKRLIMNDGKGAGGESADEQRADQAGRVGDGDGVDIVPGAISVRQGFFDDRVNNFQVMTPPYSAWMSIWELTTLESRRSPSSTTAAAVSSQLDSIPKILICFYYSKYKW